jgi:hypothetical protein
LNQSYIASYRMGEAMAEYAEQLPPHCPPNEAEDKPLKDLYRLVAAKPVPANAFDSHAKLGKPNRSNANACGFASCSLLGDYNKYLENLPGLRKVYSHFAKLDIPAGTGKSKAKNKNATMHVDFWCYAGKNLKNCVVEVLPIPQEEDSDA